MSGELLVGPNEMARTIRRLAHEILEDNHGPDGLVLVGILTRGYPLAQRIAGAIEEFEKIRVPVGWLDIGLYRDDADRRQSRTPVRASAIPDGVEGRTVVLVDDVLYTGRSVRAALDGLLDFGRPATVRLAVLVDRGHREIPIRADFVGKNFPTAKSAHVEVALTEIDGHDRVALVASPDAQSVH